MSVIRNLRHSWPFNEKVKCSSRGVLCAPVKTLPLVTSSLFYDLFLEINTAVHHLIAFIGASSLCESKTLSVLTVLITHHHYLFNYKFLSPNFAFISRSDSLQIFTLIFPLSSTLTKQKLHANLFITSSYYQASPSPPHQTHYNSSYLSSPPDQYMFHLLDALVRCLSL